MTFLDIYSMLISLIYHYPLIPSPTPAGVLPLPNWFSFSIMCFISVSFNGKQMICTSVAYMSVGEKLEETVTSPLKKTSFFSASKY